MKKNLLAIITVLTLLTIGETQAQRYQHAVGVTLGVEMGFSYKTFFTRESAIEANFGYNIHTDGVMFSAAYQYHIPLIRNLSLYAGGGFNIGGQYLGHHWHKGKFMLGIDPTVGFEFRVPSAPIAFAVDYRPNINFTGHSQWNLAAFKIRYIF